MASIATQDKLRTLIALDVGLSKPVAGKSFQDIISRGEVLAVPLDGRDPVLITSDVDFVTLPDGVVYSAKRQRIYFTNMGIPPLNDGSVCSARLDGTHIETVLAKGSVHTPKQLALDHINEKLYISDREGLRVMRCDLDGSCLETLIQTGDYRNPDDARDQTKWCVGIAVSSKTGLFYWTQKGPSKSGHGRIFCAPIDAAEGRRHPVCVLDNLPEPIDLEFDETSNILYWTDRGEVPYGNTFNRIRLDASGTGPATVSPDAVTGLRHEILAQNFDETIGLAFDKAEGRWYISDMGGTIWIFDIKSRSKSKLFEDKSRSFTGIVLVARG